MSGAFNLSRISRKIAQLRAAEQRTARNRKVPERQGRAKPLTDSRASPSFCTTACHTHMRYFVATCLSVALTALLAACRASTAEPRSPDDAETCPVTLASDPGYRADIELFCNVDERISADQLDPIELSQKRDDYLVDHVKHPDGIEFLTIFRTKPDSERSQMLDEKTRAIGLKACPLRDRLAAR